MHRAIHQYLKELRLLIPLSNKQEKQFIHRFSEAIKDFSKTAETLSYESLCIQFGSPKEVAITYFDEVDFDYLIKKLQFSRFLHRCIIIGILIVMAVSIWKAGLYYKSYRDAQSSMVSYYIETIE